MTPDTATGRSNRLGTDERTITLCQLETGKRARVLAADLCCEDCELLRAMGMGEECTVRVCRSGEPCIVEVSGTRLGLSRAMTRNIFVSVEPEGAGNRG